jgi:hypothetical protein
LPQPKHQHFTTKQEYHFWMQVGGFFAQKCPWMTPPGLDDLSPLDDPGPWMTPRTHLRGGGW